METKDFLKMYYATGKCIMLQENVLGYGKNLLCYRKMYYPNKTSRHQTIQTLKKYSKIIKSKTYMHKYKRKLQM